MTFDTDRQTLADLNIFPKERGIKSVFDYYNRTQTTGGKDLLLSFMGSPLNDLFEIRIEKRINYACQHSFLGLLLEE